MVSTPRVRSAGFEISKHARDNLPWLQSSWTLHSSRTLFPREHISEPTIHACELGSSELQALALFTRWRTLFVTSVRGMTFLPQTAANASLSFFGAKMPFPAFFMAAAIFLPFAFAAFLPIARFSAVIFLRVA